MSGRSREAEGGKRGLGKRKNRKHICMVHVSTHTDPDRQTDREAQGEREMQMDIEVHKQESAHT